MGHWERERGRRSPALPASLVAPKTYCRSVQSVLVVVVVAMVCFTALHFSFIFQCNLAQCFLAHNTHTTFEQRQYKGDNFPGQCGRIQKNMYRVKRALKIEFNILPNLNLNRLAGVCVCVCSLTACFRCGLYWVKVNGQNRKKGHLKIQQNKAANRWILAIDFRLKMTKRNWTEILCHLNAVW